MAKATTNMQGAGGTPKIRVKQDMIDFIKTQGMTRALKRAGEINAKGTKGEAEFIEGVRRMYGANRLAAATKTATPAKFNAPAGANKKPAGRMTKSAAPAKKNNSTSTALKVAGGVAAAGALIASRGKAAGLASKLSPGLSKSAVGKALSMGAAKAGPKSVSNIMAKRIASAKEAAGTKAMSTAGRAAAKAKRPVSQSQYDAMRAEAARKGIKPPVKSPAKPPVKKKAAGTAMGAATLKGNAAKKTTKKK